MTSDPAPRAIDIATVVIGALVALIGLASILSFADHLLYLSDFRDSSAASSSSVAYVGGEALLVVAEVAAVLLFTAVSIAVVVLRRHPGAVALAIGGAAGKILWLAASVAANWEPGWYYILDPKGAHPVTMYLFAGSIAQAAIMTAAAVAALRGRTASDLPGVPS